MSYGGAHVAAHKMTVAAVNRPPIRDGKGKEESVNRKTIGGETRSTHTL